MLVEYEQKSPPSERVKIMLKPRVRRVTASSSEAHLLALLIFMVGCTDSLSMDLESPDQDSADLSEYFIAPEICSDGAGPD